MYKIQGRGLYSILHGFDPKLIGLCRPHARVHLWSIPMVVVNRRHCSDRKKNTGKEEKKQTKKNLF
jgi:hypothetical protein